MWKLSFGLYISVSVIIEPLVSPNFILPLTCNFSLGFVSPIPTFPSTRRPSVGAAVVPE